MEDLRKLRKLLETEEETEEEAGEEAGEEEDVASIAHGLKGELGTLGFMRGYNTAKELERLLEEKHFADALELLEDLEEDIQDMEDFFARPDWKELL